MVWCCWQVSESLNLNGQLVQRWSRQAAHDSARARFEPKELFVKRTMMIPAQNKTVARIIAATVGETTEMYSFEKYWKGNVTHGATSTVTLEHAEAKACLTRSGASERGA